MVTYRRIKLERVKKWAKTTGIIGIPTSILLIAFLFSLGAIDITNFSGDSACAGTIENPCYAFVNFTPNTDIYVYPNSSWELSTDRPIKQAKLYRSWGTGWRYINLSKTWNKDVKYSIKFNKDQDYQIKYEVLKYNPEDEIKWSFTNQADPTWYGTDYKENYDSKTQTIQVKSGETNISSLELLVPARNHKVPVGKNVTFARIKVDTSVMVSEDIFGLIETLNYSTLENITKVVSIKKERQSTELVNDTAVKCTKVPVWNGTIEECVSYVNGTKYVPVTLYEDFDKSSLQKGEMILALQMDVNPGEHIEWYANLFGSTWKEWADFEAYTLYEHMNVASTSTYGCAVKYDTWKGQCFKVGVNGANVAQDVEGVEIKAWIYAGSPNDLEVYITSAVGCPGDGEVTCTPDVTDVYATNRTVDPAGVSSGGFPGDSFNITMNSERSLSQNGCYAVMINTTDTNSNYIRINENFPAGGAPNVGYTGGNLSGSADSGATWTDYRGEPASRMWFSVYGTDATPTSAYNFSGIVYNQVGVPLAGINVSIIDQIDDSIVFQTISNASGGWNWSTDINHNYTIIAYDTVNWTRFGDIDPWINAG